MSYWETLPSSLSTTAVPAAHDDRVPLMGLPVVAEINHARPIGFWGWLRSCYIVHTPTINYDYQSISLIVVIIKCLSTFKGVNNESPYTTLGISRQDTL